MTVTLHRRRNELGWLHAGCACRIVENGTWRGYVHVGPAHPWHRQHHAAVPAELHEIHGGLTFGDYLFADREHWWLGRDWWLGFVCGHGVDCARSECERLAEQVAAAAPGVKS